FAVGADCVRAARRNRRAIRPRVALRGPSPRPHPDIGSRHAANLLRSGVAPDFASRRAVLFDLDGTIVDSAADIAAALNRALALEGLAPFDEPQVRAMIGDGAAVLVGR